MSSGPLIPASRSLRRPSLSPNMESLLVAIQHIMHSGAVFPTESLNFSLKSYKMYSSIEWMNVAFWLELMDYCTCMWSLITPETESGCGYSLLPVICSAKSLSPNVRQMREGIPESAIVLSQVMDITLWAFLQSRVQRRYFIPFEMMGSCDHRCNIYSKVGRSIANIYDRGVIFTEAWSVEVNMLPRSDIEAMDQPTVLQYLSQVTYGFTRNCRVDIPENAAR